MRAARACEARNLPWQNNPWLTLRPLHHVRPKHDLTNDRSSARPSCSIDARWGGLPLTSVPSSNHGRRSGGGLPWRLPRRWLFFFLAPLSIWFRQGSASGATTFRLAGLGTSPISSSGSVSVTPEH